MRDSFPLLLACYRSRQMSERQWQAASLMPHRVLS